MSIDDTRPHDPADRDVRLLEMLRGSLAALPDDLRPSDPPPSVLDGAKWVHDWLNMDADLAQLTFDSEEDLELAGVRSSSSLRELTFVSGSTTIDIEVEPGPRTVRISGRVEPAVDGRIQLVVAGEVFAADLDDGGAFDVDGIATGTVLAFLDTPTGKIRLGSFEV